MNEITLYDKIENPIEAAEKMGVAFAKSGMFGCDKVEQGMVLALACMAERKTPFEILRTYHIMGGKLSMRADAMLAAFRNAGGEYEWLTESDNREEAKLQLTPKGAKKPTTIRYTIEDAKRANLVRPDSGWTKTPAAMLRARATSTGIRMLAPEIVAGVYTPEEVQDYTNGDPKPALLATKPAVTPAPQKAPPEPKAEVKDVTPKPEKPAATPPPLPAAAKEQAEEPATDEQKGELEILLQENHESDANAYCLGRGWINEGQTFRDISKANAATILAKQQMFIRAIAKKKAA